MKLLYPGQLGSKRGNNLLHYWASLRSGSKPQFEPRLALDFSTRTCLSYWRGLFRNNTSLVLCNFFIFVPTSPCSCNKPITKLVYPHTLITRIIILVLTLAIHINLILFQHFCQLHAQTHICTASVMLASFPTLGRT